VAGVKCSFAIAFSTSEGRCSAESGEGRQISHARQNRVKAGAPVHTDQATTNCRSSIDLKTYTNTRKLRSFNLQDGANVHNCWSPNRLSPCMYAQSFYDPEAFENSSTSIDSPTGLFIVTTGKANPILIYSWQWRFSERCQLGFIVSWEDRKRKRPKARPSTLKVQTKKASLSTYTLHNAPGRLH